MGCYHYQCSSCWVVLHSLPCIPVVFDLINTDFRYRMIMEQMILYCCTRKIWILTLSTKQRWIIKSTIFWDVTLIYIHLYTGSRLVMFSVKLLPLEDDRLNFCYLAECFIIVSFLFIPLYVYVPLLPGLCPHELVAISHQTPPLTAVSELSSTLDSTWTDSLLVWVWVLCYDWRSVDQSVLE
jgi:hypothetical protein